MSPFLGFSWHSNAGMPLLRGRIYTPHLVLESHQLESEPNGQPSNRASGICYEFKTSSQDFSPHPQTSSSLAEDLLVPSLHLRSLERALKSPSSRRTISPGTTSARVCWLHAVPSLRFIDADEKVSKHGFALKVGAAVKLNQHKREGYTDFINGDISKAAWNVERDEFDEMLLRHADQNGARICEGVQVTGITFASDNADKPVSAQWKSDTGIEGETRFDWLVDCSGRNGIMSTKYLKNRKFNQALKNTAFWSYWEGAGKYGAGTSRENSPWFEALTDETGWAWFIPLSGKVSVGVVLKEDISRVKKSSVSGPDVNKTHYLNQLKLAPGVLSLLGDAKMVADVKNAADYSYQTEGSKYAGPNYRMAGDAGCEPSSLWWIQCTHLCSSIRELYANILNVWRFNLCTDRPILLLRCPFSVCRGLSAASSIAASIRGHCTEAEAIQFHNSKTERSYTRFMLVVLSAYRQITAQEDAVLSDIDEDNFDRAFDFIRPIIQGTADTTQRITHESLVGAMDLVAHALGPTTPEVHADVAARVDPSLMARTGPILNTKVVEELAAGDENVKQVLWRVNARKTLDNMYGWENTFLGENIDGFTIILKRGALGLGQAS
ncbi:hypothetical protein MSAN_02509700 [Mycena sanguinolenta]|uniref:Halogenase n=1 Tax=Mycena sanguinolenta TaxID=230812 RepID=A0A8H6WU15_9AGAR|nr:hypothetical protein MSAN_02509700 [Mycena sanguinolenta]